MKLSNSIFSICLVPLIGALLLLTGLETDPIQFVSEESKTIEGNPVINEVQFKSTESYDQWTMLQSHSGIGLPKSDWDELQIVVNKTQVPYTATYKQFKNGNEVEYRVSCFVCHSNGPRLIRPDVKSTLINLSLSKRIQISLWNLRIKSYGKIVTVGEEMMLKNTRKVPLKFQSSLDRTVLTVKTCQYCHGGSGPFSRSPLVRQQAATISYMVDSGAMPPWPFKLDDHERQQLMEFIQGI